MTDPLTEAVARAICKAKGGDPCYHYRHRPDSDYPTDYRAEYICPLSGETRFMLAHFAWRNFVPEAQAAIAAIREQLVPQWQPIDTAPDLERVIVAGWYNGRRRLQGYWWWHEDAIHDGRAIDHPDATLWRPIGNPPFPAAPAGGEG